VIDAEKRPVAANRGPMIIDGEDSLRSQYMSLEPSVKILKRPTREERLAAGREACNGVGKPVKSLRQREAEYAEARLRIMGNSNNDDEVYDR